MNAAINSFLYGGEIKPRELIKARGGNPNPRNQRRAILTEALVLEMREKFKTGDYNFVQLGKIYGVSQITARDAVRGLKWKHVKGAIPAKKLRKLDAEKVREMRFMFANTSFNRAEIARKFGISPSAGRSAINGATWRNV